MKYEWKKEMKDLYDIKLKTPKLINTPQQLAFAIKGKGDPDEQVFKDKIKALYSQAYSIKMLYKKDS